MATVLSRTGARLCSSTSTTAAAVAASGGIYLHLRQHIGHFRSIIGPASKVCCYSTTPADDHSTEFVSPQIDPRFRYGDVIVLNDNKGDRRLIGPLKKGIFRDTNNGRLAHDDLIGLGPLSTIKSHKGAKYTLHWPSLDEYCTKVKRQATIMYPKDATSAVHLLDLFPGAHVLEAGTGNGSMTLYIQRAIQGPGSHLDTVDIRSAHSQQAEENVSRFWRGMYRPGITFWRSAGGLQKVIQHLSKNNNNKEAGKALADQDVGKVNQDSAVPECDSTGRRLNALERRRQQLETAKEILPENPHPPDHQYDAISLDLPDCKSVILDLVPLLKPDRPMCLYMVNMSQVLELVQWMRKNDIQNQLAVEKVLEVDWKEWSVRSAAVRSKVKGRVHVGGLGNVLKLPQAAPSAEGDDRDQKAQESFTAAADNIPDDAVGWVCRPLHMPTGHTGFLVQLRKTSE
ncbi:hypothetical protein EDD11_008181 [Mortierella claussenii]|nr:hypothetical protein EDD11_008181 [Mortierella claussenii]